MQTFMPLKPETNSPDRLMTLAANALRAGQFEAARDHAGRALEVSPDSVPALFLLGVAYARLGDADLAIRHLSRVIELDAHAYEAIVSLATLLRENGRFDEAIELCQRGVTLRPNDAQAHNNLGRALMASRRLDEACLSFEGAIALQPTFAPAHHNLGKAKQLDGKDGEAVQAFSHAARLAPTLENLFALGQTFITLCDYEAAASCARQLVSLFPASASAHLLACGAMTEIGEIAQAEEHLRRAIELDPTGNEALQTAIRQRPLGYIEEANENLRRALEKNPRQIAAFDSLMQNQKVTETDRALVNRMRALAQTESLSQTELISVNYGLGKALEDLKEFEESMRHYDEANRITRLVKFGTAPFDEARYEKHVDRILASFGAVDNVRKSGVTSNSDIPILIIGMMRSGTSLSEQILSSHPQVEGVGEQLYWSRNWNRAIQTDANELIQSEIEALGHEYVSEMTSKAPKALRITDKMPGNYLFAGLIHRALPNARIIHIRRLPVDTCLSIWATPNHMPHEGGNNKADIAFVYKQYLRVMEHWRRTLPADRFLEIDYEQLVSDPRQVIGEMLDFCGLPWDDACLNPQENKRMVATPSAWQVRQPFYKTSVERWRKYEPWLGEFSQLVGLKHGPAVAR